MKSTVTLNPRYKQLSEFVNALPREFGQSGTVIYDRRNQIRVITTPDGIEVNVKRFGYSSLGINRLIYSAGLRRPKGERAYRHAALLAQKGISTPEPIAYLEQRQCGLLRHCYLVTEQSPMRHTMYEMKDATPGNYEEIAYHLGRFTAMMHEKEVLHLDYSPGNILWDRDDLGYHFCIVDINRMHFGPVSLAAGCRSLRRLWGPKRFVELVACSYAQNRNYDAGQAVELTLAARQRFWKHYRHTDELPFTVEY